MKQGGVVTYLHGDHLGSSALATNASGNITSKQTYYAFGDVRSVDVGAMGTDYAFTGQHLDASTANGGRSGLLFYRSRYYDSNAGRFIQPDNLVPSPLNPQSLNRYSYGLNNPVKYRDPSGHIPLVAFMFIGGAVNTGIDWFMTTQVQHQQYSLERAAVTFAIGAGFSGLAGAATSALTPVAEAAAADVLGDVAASSVVSTIVKGATTGTVTGFTNVGAQATQAGAVGWLNGASKEQCLDLASRRLASSAGEDFLWGFVAGSAESTIRIATTPPNPYVTVIEGVKPSTSFSPGISLKGSSVPRTSLFPEPGAAAQIVASGLSNTISNAGSSQSQSSVPDYILYDNPVFSPWAWPQ